MPDPRPPDFAVTYSWDTGSLPPRYHRRVTVSIAPDGQGATVTEHSYGKGETHTEAFTLDAEQMDALYADLVDLGAFSTAWRDDRPRHVGGKSWSVTVTAGGRTVRIPSFVVEAQRDAKRGIGTRVEAAAGRA